jgi:hypothetical protein
MTFPPVSQNEIVILTEQLQEEAQNWEAMGINPQQINIDAWQMDIKVEAMRMMIMTLTGFDVEEFDEQFDLYFKRAYLKNLKTAREIVTPMVREQRLNALRVPAGAEKQVVLLGPNGQPMEF